MKVALYARVSTNNHGQDVNLQLSELREYCQRRGWAISSEYVDAGVSGSKDSRPELNRLMADAKQRQFDAVLVWKLDRFGRSLKHLVVALAEFESLGITFVSLRDSLDLTTPQGRLMFGIISSFAEFERSLIQERVRAGLRNARSRGQKLGRPCADAITREKIESLRSAGFSHAVIADQLGVSVRTVYSRIAR